jgi:hypothetical protein
METDSVNYAQGKVSVPAMTLAVLSGISIGLLLLGLAFDVWYVFSGTARKMAEVRGDSHESVVAVRMVWAVAMLIANAVIMAGAIGMKQLRNRGLAQVACVLSLIPCLGPCFVLGIPFGIWGLVALNDPQVREAFRS